LNPKLILGGVLLGAFLVPFSAFGYSQNTTHPALTDEIVDFYNLSFKDNTITQEEKQWLIKGSIDEDDGGRFFSHFYDPIYDRGLQSVFTVGVPTISSKKWAMGDTQKSFYNGQLTGYAAISGADSIHDFSYDRALKDYAKGDKQRAFIAFGHVLHLIEDAGVPDHTRNDPHPPVLDMGSPYEHEMDKWNPENFQIARTLFLTREKPAALSDIGSYLDRVANYSNNNFLSRDTISNRVYVKPNVNNLKKLRVGTVERLFIVNIDQKGIEFPLALVIADSVTKKVIGITLYNEIVNSYILDGYWDRLSKEVVVSGAGALRLFLEEAERAKKEYLVKAEQKKPSFWAQVASLFGFGGVNDGLTTSEGLGTSDVVNDELSTSPTFDVGNPQGGDSGDKDGDTSGDTNLSPTVSPLSPRLSPSPLVTPKVSPSVSPKPSMTPDPSPLSTTEKININMADKALLMTLKGIKDAKSDAIIQHRQTYGSFQRIEDIMNVSGIGQSTFNDIKDQITVGDITPTPTPVTSYSGGGGGGGGSGSSSPTPSVSPTPTPTPTPSSEPDGDNEDGDTANSGDVVINEIAWMGTEASTADEWIEFYNTTNGTINLNNWTLKSQDETPNITLTGSISPLSYYLLERTDDDTLPTISADQIYTGALGNEGENLVLKDVSGTTINEVDGSNSWKLNGDDEIIGDNTTKKTAQRMDSGWITATATPKAQNSADTTAQAPSAVTNLATAHGSPTITATWTASNPGTYNIASLSYDLRYSSTIFTEVASASWWSAATVVASSSLPSVGVEGAFQSASFDVAQEYGQTLYFVLKVIHRPTFNVGHEGSGVSNVASVNFPTAIDDGAWGMFGKDQYHTSLAIVAGPAGPSPTISNFSIGPDDPLSEFDNVFRSDQISAPCGNGGDNIRLYDHQQNSNGAFPCAGGAGTWGSYFNASFNDTVFTQFEQVGTLPCGTYAECENKNTTLSTRKIVLRTDGWTPPPAWSISQPVADADGNIYFGATDGSSYKLIKLNKNGAKPSEWEDYDTNVSIGAPVVLSDGTVYFGRIGAGGAQFFTALDLDGTKKWDYSGSGKVWSITANSKGEAYFSFDLGKLTALNPDGTEKIPTISKFGVGGTPVVLENGTVITAVRDSGNHYFTALASSDGTQLWQVYTSDSNDKALSDPSYDSETDTTYSAAGPKLFAVPQNSQDGQISSSDKHTIAQWDYSAATTVAISSDTLYVGFNAPVEASGSRVLALDKSNLTEKWSAPFQADGFLNKQLVVDSAGNVYFSTQNGKLYGVDSTGAQRWVIDSGSNSTISPVLTGHGLVWSYSNKVVLISD